MYELSISVVTYNNEKEILNLLKGIYKFSSNISFKVFVIDNESKDGTVKLIEKNYPEVEIIKSKKNIGFGRAHNLILERIESEFHLIINPDVIITSKVIKNLIFYLKKIANCSGDSLDIMQEFENADDKVMWNYVESYIKTYISQPSVGIFLKKINYIN